METTPSAKVEPVPADIYPKINIPLIQNPNRFYAVPLIGALVKVFAIIPVGIELFFLWLFFLVVTLVNSFYVLFTGKYWPFAYNYNLGLIKLNTKVYFYFTGLTDKYPGFDFNINDNYTVEMEMPQNPNRLFAIPILGGLIRLILLIPYVIYEYVIQYAAGIGVLVSFIPVLFMGKYPEATYELARDYNRVNMASTAYLMGLSDKYPSFWISWNHKTAKIILIVISILYILSNLGNTVASISKISSQSYKNDLQYNKQLPYNQQNTNNPDDIEQ